MEYVMLMLPLLLAWLLDRWLGDPAWLPHPVVAFGRAISHCEHALNKGRGRFLKGTITAIVLVVLTFLVTYVLLRSASIYISPWLKAALETVLIFYCLAGTTLAERRGYRPSLLVSVAGCAGDDDVQDD